MDEKEKIDFLLSRGIEKLIEEKTIKEKFLSGESLRIKYGIDPTATDLHLGHYVIFRKLRKMQDLGHKVIFLIGGFTARFGDPTDREKVRKLRDKEEVTKVSNDYLNQIKGILDFDKDKLEIRDNSEWYDQMRLEEFLQILSYFSYAKMIGRSMFQKRLSEKKEIKMHELIYPVLQGYDSVVIKSDIALGGADQVFNELIARDLQQEFDQKTQDLILLKMIPGTDGKKLMSQSAGNIIKIKEDPKIQFSKIMSISDDIIFSYFESLTDIPEEEIKVMKDSIKKGFNPKELKMKLAKEIVAEIWGQVQAQKAEDYFTRVFSKGRISEVDIESQKIESKEYLIKDLITFLDLADSKSEAIRLIKQKAVEINQKLVSDPFKKITPQDGDIVKVGKYRFKKIEL